jgi:hypothetical protein
MASEATGLVQGTFHMLILKTLTLEPLHGYGIGLAMPSISLLDQRWPIEHDTD